MSIKKLFIIIPAEELCGKGIRNIPSSFGRPWNDADEVKLQGRSKDKFSN
jgi:hypothetical protein